MQCIKNEFFISANKARAIYFYGPMSVTVICNICLFISTALKIVRHKKDTAQHLRSSESRRHDDNKQWFAFFSLIHNNHINILYADNILYPLLNDFA